MTLHDTKSTAKKYGLTPTYLSKARCVGTPNIPYVRIGRLIRYDWEEIDAWMARNTYNCVERAL